MMEVMNAPSAQRDTTGGEFYCSSRSTREMFFFFFQPINRVFPYFPTLT
jgi:hypothetical protein